MRDCWAGLTAVVWCVVWCGVVWCGVVWCGVVWCGVVWCGVVWCGVVWCGVVWCGVVWCGVVWCGVVWCGVVWCGVVWCGGGPAFCLSVLGEIALIHKTWLLAPCQGCQAALGRSVSEAVDRTVDSGQWTVDSGQWTVDSGQTVDSVHHCVQPHSCGWVVTSLDGW